MAASRTTRRVGYVIAAIFNVVFLIVASNLLAWGWLPWLTEDFERVLPLIILSLLASAVVNIAYIVHDGVIFKSATQIVVNLISLAATIRLLGVFPFDFTDYNSGWEALARLVLVVAIMGLTIGIVADVVKLGRALYRHGSATGAAHGASET